MTQTFRPSMVVNLRLRFDESLFIAPSMLARINAASSGALETHDGKEFKPSDGRRRRGPQIRLGNTRVQDAFGERVITHSPEQAGYTGLEPLVTPTDDMTQLMNRQPILASVTMPSPRQAATFSMEFDFRDLPIDPRLVRAVGVEVHLGTVSDDDYAAGMSGRRDDTGRLLSVLRTRSELMDPFTGKPAVELQTLLFYGTADTWKVNHGEGGSRATLTGRDLRGIFLDTRIPAGRVAKVNLEQPIDRVVADILATLPAKFDLVIDVFTDRNEWPRGAIPSPADRKGVTRLRLDEGGAAGSQPAGGDQLRYWDLITQYCNLVGGIPYFEGTALWIRPARAVHQTLTDRRFPTPFRGGRPRIVGGQVVNGQYQPEEEVRIRRIVHGQHVKSLEIERKFGGVVVPAVECVSIDDRFRGEEALIVARWPPANTVAGALKEDGDVLRIPVPGCVDKDRLLAVAQDTYEEIGRGEFGGTLETLFLSSFGGDAADPDLLTLRSATPLEIVVDSDRIASRAPIIDELVRHQSRSFSEEVTELTRHLGDPVLARALVATARGAVVGQIDIFRVSEVRYDWNKGVVRVQASFHNYILARHAQARQESPDQRSVSQRRVKVKGKQGRVKIGQAVIEVQQPLVEFVDREFIQDPDVPNPRPGDPVSIGNAVVEVEQPSVKLPSRRLRRRGGVTMGVGRATGSNDPGAGGGGQ